jgi:hypothetical protein
MDDVRPGGLLADYMTPDELARELNVALVTLSRWRSRKKGPPCIKMGLRVLYSRASVRKWLEQLETKPQF